MLLASCTQLCNRIIMKAPQVEVPKLHNIKLLIAFIHTFMNLMNIFAWINFTIYMQAESRITGKL